MRSLQSFFLYKRPTKIDPNERKYINLIQLLNCLKIHKLETLLSVLPKLYYLLHAITIVYKTIRRNRLSAVVKCIVPVESCTFL